MMADRPNDPAQPRVEREPMVAEMLHGYCGECGEELIATGTSWSHTFGTSYEHKCGCGLTMRHEIFPRIEHVPAPASAEEQK